MVIKKNRKGHLIFYYKNKYTKKIYAFKIKTGFRNMSENREFR